MATYSTDRRGALKILASIGASCACPIAGDELFGQTAEHAHNQTPAATATRFFSAADFATVSRIVDLIIPASDTPGAVAAGVPDYIDAVVSRNTLHQALMSDGLRWLDGFTALTEAQQLAILQPLCEAVDAGNTAGRMSQFFGLMKSLTADGYYTSQIGLIQELGYKGNTPMASFPDCEHEH